MRVQAVQFLVDVHLLRQKHQLLLQAITVDPGLQLGQPGLQFVANFCLHLRQPLTGLLHLFLYALQTGAQKRLDRLTFTLAGGDQLVQRLVQQLQGLLLHRAGVGLGITHHPGPAQQIDDPRRGRLCGTLLDQPAGVQHRFQPVLVQLQRRGQLGRPAATQHALQLAAPEACVDPLTHQRLHRPQLVREAHEGLQVAVIHRSQFPGQLGLCRLDTDTGESGHAADHLKSPSLPAARGIFQQTVFMKDFTWRPKLLLADSLEDHA